MSEIAFLPKVKKKMINSQTGFKIISVNAKDKFLIAPVRLWS